MKTKRKTYDILSENINKISSVEELKEMVRYNHLIELDEFVENNKNIEIIIGNTDLYPIYKKELQKKIDNVKKWIK